MREAPRREKPVPKGTGFLLWPEVHSENRSGAEKKWITETIDRPLCLYQQKKSGNETD